MARHTDVVARCHQLIVADVIVMALKVGVPGALGALMWAVVNVTELAVPMLLSPFFAHAWKIMVLPVPIGPVSRK